MTRKLSTIFIFLLLIYSFSVTAITEYPQAGGEDNNFRTGTGFFNAQLANESFFTRNIGDPNYLPLISDLDGDGTKQEIIIVDGTDLKLYNDKELNILDSVQFLTGVNSPISNIVIADLNDDGLKEIIYFDEAQQAIEMYNWNGTDIIFLLQAEVTISAGSTLGNDSIVGCDDNRNICLLMRYAEDGTNTQRWEYWGFNSSNQTLVPLIDSIGIQNTQCLPIIKSMPLSDSDNDGDEEFHISAFTASNVGGVKEGFHFERVYVYDNLTVVQELLMDENSGGFGFTDFISSGTRCDEYTLEVEQMITSPLMLDVDGSSSNGIEAVIGVNVDADQFKMFSIKESGIVLDDYPETFLADGLLVSNPIAMNAFTDTGDTDFCVMGYQNTSQRIDLLCASELTGNIPETNEFVYNITDVPQVDQDRAYFHVVHQAQMSTQTTDGTNLDEIITPYGVMRLIQEGDDDASILCSTIGFCDLEVIWTNTKGVNSAFVPIDYEKIDRHDLILLTDTNLWYIDDGFTNTNCDTQNCIDEYTINPCLDATWQLNTSTEFLLKIIDIDSDDIAGRVILYEGDSNEQDSGWTANASSGTTFTIGGLTANKTISLGNLQLQARDTNDPTKVETIDLAFSVNTEGVEFGDCTTSVTDLAEAAAAAAAAAAGVDILDQDDNAIVNFMDDILGSTGLGHSVMWLFVMIVAAVGLIIGYTKFGSHGLAEFYTFAAIIGMVELLLLIMGVLLGFFSIGIIITIVVVAMVIIGGVIAIQLRSGSGGG